MWTRTEPRDLSPFFDLQDASDLLKDATIVLRPGDEPTSTPRHVLDPEQMLALAPMVRPMLSSRALETALGDEAAAYDLILTVETPQMMRRTIEGRWPCDGAIPDVIELSSGSVDDGRLAGLVEIGLAICLRETGPAQLGRPEYAGSRLAEAHFSLGIDRRQNTFAFEELTEEIRRQRQLPPGTTFHVELDPDDLVTALDTDRAMAVVYVTPSLLAIIRNGSPKPALSAIVSVQIMDAVLEVAARSDLGAVVEKGSGLERLIDWTSDGGKRMDATEFREAIGDAGRRRAIVQDRLGLTSTLSGLR